MILYRMLLCGWLTLSAARAADLTIDGEVARPMHVSVAELRQAVGAAVAPIEYITRGQKHHATAIPLLAALQSAGVETTIAPAPTTPPGQKHPTLRQAVLVRGGDGYAVVFSVAELLPSVGKRGTYLTFDQDDAPLPDGHGPIKLIVPDDAGPARAVRNVTSLTVVTVTPPGTQPAE